MRIIIDSREQTPLTFRSETVTRGLLTGDYTIEGYEQLIVVERKSLDDLVNSVIHDWLRFSRVCRRMASFDYACIAVEGTAADVMNGKYTSDAVPESVRGKLNSIAIKFGIWTIFLDNPVIMAEWVENLFQQYLSKTP